MPGEPAIMNFDLKVLVIDILYWYLFTLEFSDDGFFTFFNKRTSLTYINGGCIGCRSWVYYDCFIWVFVFVHLVWKWGWIINIKTNCIWKNGQRKASNLEVDLKYCIGLRIKA